MAFDEYQIKPPGLQEYLDEVDQLPFPNEVYQFPVKRSNRHVYESSIPPPVMARSTLIGENSDGDEEDKEAWSPLIPTYLPPLPNKEETEKGHYCIMNIVWLDVNSKNLSLGVLSINTFI